MLVVIEKEIAYVSTAVKTGLQIICAAERQFLVKFVEFTFLGTARNAPVRLSILRQSTAGTSTGAVAPNWFNSYDTDTISVTANHTFTAEPTSVAARTIASARCSPDGDRWRLDWRGMEGAGIYIPKAGRLGFAVTGADSVSYNLCVIGSE